MHVVGKDLHILAKSELRRQKFDRDQFLARPRRPIVVVLDGVRRNYNLGAIFRLCDAFLIERLVICGPPVELRKRKLVQAARGTQHWVPWVHVPNTSDVVQSERSRGARIIVAEQTNSSVRIEQLTPKFPVSLVLGSEKTGVSPDVVQMADDAVAIPMLGMGNSLNVASTAAIVLHWLAVMHQRSVSDDQN